MGLSRSSLAQVGVGMLSQRKENHLGLEKLVLMARDWRRDLQLEGTAWKGHGKMRMHSCGWSVRNSEGCGWKGPGLVR